jgi:phage-related protein (TIGR01555 family)
VSLDVVETTAAFLAQGLIAAGRRADGWSNGTTGMGTWRDKTRQTFFGGSCELGPSELEELYAHEDVAGRGVDLIPDECFRPGYHLEFEEKDDPRIKQFCDQAELLNLNERLIEADCAGRLHGGSLLLFGKDDGQSASTPLRITDGQTDWIDVLDCQYYSVLSYYKRGPKTGQPELYALGSPGPNAQPGFVVHESRTIAFGGARTTRQAKIRRGWRDYSVLQRPYDVIRKFATGFEAVGQLLSDGPQGVFSIDGLRDLVSVHGTAAIEARVELIDRMRSFVRGMIVDGKGEKFERQQVPFAGIDAILDRLMLRLSAAMYEPMVLLFGMSPAGFSTGDTDVRIWHNRCRAREVNYLTPRVRDCARVLLGLPDIGDLEVCWGNLWEQTEGEKADTKLKNYQADKLDFDMGVREPEEIFLDREGQDGWDPSEDAIERRQAALEAMPDPDEHGAFGQAPGLEGMNGPIDPNAPPGSPAKGQAPGAPPKQGATVRPGNAPGKPGAPRPAPAA